ncbi:hypothetical protein [Pedobacter suwonensis]|uniref:hypothetical protein n=1 Tax=Pedobacter suwonensis TaxID=332999 RepID=UPI0011A7CF61|nr:hypothetical protein [Pedobacter suwonensis]
MNKLPALSLKPLAAILILFSLFCTACSETPERFFDIAILNTNMINDFASADLARHIEDETKEYPDIPSSKKKGDEAAISINNKILYLEQSLEKVKKLSASGEEEKQIKALSQQLYELVIPVYKNEYLAYAKLCDSKGSRAAKDEMIKNIAEKYGARFEQNFNALMEKGKTYAREHNIQVNWGK